MSLLYSSPLNYGVFLWLIYRNKWINRSRYCTRKAALMNSLKRLGGRTCDVPHYFLYSCSFMRNANTSAESTSLKPRREGFKLCTALYIKVWMYLLCTENGRLEVRKTLKKYPDTEYVNSSFIFYECSEYKEVLNAEASVSPGHSLTKQLYRNTTPLLC